LPRVLTAYQLLMLKLI